MNRHLSFIIRNITLLVVLLFLPGIFSVSAQDSLLVKGTVLSGNNKPLSNISVSIEGSYELPVITDDNGRFTLKSASGKNWLIISPSSDFKKKRVFINNRSRIKIYLTSEDLSSGDDLYSILSKPVYKRNIVSSFSELNVKNIQQSPVISVDQFMQGRVPGMHVVNRSGDPSSGATTLIRGTNSLNASNQPLYIIDGIPLTSQSLFGSNLDGFEYNPLTIVNPADISKTTIIKDPAVTAAYGSKASNGLVIVETLDPSATQTSIDVDFRTGYSLSPSNLIPQLNAKQHKTLINEVLFTSGMHEELIKEIYPGLFYTEKDQDFINYQHDTKWQKLIFANSLFNNLNLKVKGGDEIARYGLSFGYINGKGIIKTTGYQGYNLRFVSWLNIFTWLKMNASVSMNYSNGAFKESAKVKETSPILASLGKSPMLNPYRYDEDGNLTTLLADVEELGTSNPLAIIENYEAKNTNYHFLSTLGFEITIRKNLDILTNFGMTYNAMKEGIFMPNKGMERYYNLEAINVAKASTNTLTSLYNNTYYRFDKNFGKDHTFINTGGVNIYTNKFEYDWGLTKNAHANDQYRMLQDGTNNLREIGGQNRLWNWVSLYENFTYSFRDRYILTGSISLDGSSRVGDNALNTIKIAGVPLGLFYAGGVAWRISGESFLKNLNWLEELKIRLSAGQSGNDDIGESNARHYYQAIRFRETVGLYPALIPNDKLSYERVSQLNAGLDLSILGNRITLNLDAFRSTTNDMLIYTPLEAYLGYSFRPENGGKMQNQGYEANLFTRIINGKSFKWDIEANFSALENKILEIKGDKLVTDIQGAQIVNMKGSQANSFYGYVFEGVFSSAQEATASGLVNNKNVAYKAGDAKYEDLSGPAGIPDGIINDYDKTAIGSSIPDFYGGLINTFTYKRWALSSFVQFVSGNELFNYVRFKNEQMTGLVNQSANILNRWQYDGQKTDVPRALWNDPVGNSAFSTRWIEDGSYLRLKNITLSYTIPDKFLAFRNAQFYLSANNVYTLSKYLGYDPEFAYSYSQINQGIDYGQTPQPRQFIFGVKLGL